MTTRTIAGYDVALDEEGFLSDPSEWNREIATALAAEAGIKLMTLRHWHVIDFCRRDFIMQGTPPTLRRITKIGGVPTKELYTLFPKGPAKKVARISGLGKPEGCI